MIVTTRKKGDVLTLKLTSSEEILGTFVEETDTHVVMSDLLGIAQIAQNQMGFVPYAMTAVPKQLSINKNAIILVAETQAELATQYLKQVTGLDIVSNSSIIHQ